MVTAPLAVASSDTSSFPSPPSSGTSLASTRFLLDEREEELPPTLETDTCADGLGDNFSLRHKTAKVLVRLGPFWAWEHPRPPQPGYLCSSPSRSFL